MPDKEQEEDINEHKDRIGKKLHDILVFSFLEEKGMNTQVVNISRKKPDGDGVQELYLAFTRDEAAWVGVQLLTWLDAMKMIDEVETLIAASADPKDMH